MVLVLRIKKRDSISILESLTGGVVPPRGLHHIMVGRTQEAEQILKDLQNVQAGSSMIKFFIGDYGSGKSFMQGLVKQVGLEKDFVVTQADFTTNKRLNGGGYALPLYTELINNLSIKTFPEGNALSILMDEWITQIQKKVKEEGNYTKIDFSNLDFVKDIEKKVVSEVVEMDTLAGGYDFSHILNIYFKGFIEEDIDIQRKALRWLRGEYGTKTEARKDLGVRNIINDDNYYSYLKVFVQFVKQIGYSGLVINLDEAVNLYKINHPLSRERNYETILSIYNDCLQGTVEGFYFTFSGTSDFLKDDRRGLYSYGALRRRLEVNRYETEEHRDLSQPVIQLIPLKQEELFVLLQRVRDIHAHHYQYQSNIEDKEIKTFIIQEFSLPGAEQYTTVGHIIKRFLDALNILMSNPSIDRQQIFNKKDIQSEEEKPDIMDRFSIT